eukprot:7884963-Karenia_brevis.AAC.1
MADALRGYWLEVFDHKCLDPQQKSKFEQQYSHVCRAWDFSGASPPGKQNIARTLQKLDDTGPGPDGIPYSGWGGTGDR